MYVVHNRITSHCRHRFHRDLAEGKIGFFGYRNRTKLSHSSHIGFSILDMLFFVVVFFPFSSSFCQCSTRSICCLSQEGEGESLNCYCVAIGLDNGKIVFKSSEWEGKRREEMMMLNLTWYTKAMSKGLLEGLLFTSLTNSFSSSSSLHGWVGLKFINFMYICRSQKYLWGC